MIDVFRNQAAKSLRILADFAGLSLKSGDSEQIQALFGMGAGTASGLSVTPDSAIRQATVGAAVRVLAETAATLPLCIYKRRPDGRGRDEARDHPLFSVLKHKPTDWLTSFQFKEGLMVNALLRGNAYALIERSGNKVTGLVPLNPDGVSVTMAQDWGPAYEATMPDNSRRKVLRRDMLHVTGPLPNGFLGRSIVTLYRETIGTALAGERWVGSTFKNQATPSGVIEHPENLSTEAIERLRKQFAEKYSGVDNAGRPMLLEEGMKWQAISLMPKDAQFIETMKFTRDQIAAIFRVPPHLVGDLERATHSNIEQQSLDFVIYCMLPWLTRVEQAMERDLLTPAEREAGYMIDFDVNSLLRGDFKSRMDGYAKGRQWGWLTTNEIRDREGMNPVPAGDSFLQPVNMFAIGGDGNKSDTTEQGGQK